MRVSRGERGQTTVEYILLIVAIVAFFLVAVAILRPRLKQLGDFISKTVEEKLFPTGESLHRFPIGN